MPQFYTWKSNRIGRRVVCNLNIYGIVITIILLNYFFPLRTLLFSITSDIYNEWRCTIIILLTIVICRANNLPIKRFQMTQKLKLTFIFILLLNSFKCIVWLQSFFFYMYIRDYDIQRLVCNMKILSNFSIYITNLNYLAKVA